MYKQILLGIAMAFLMMSCGTQKNDNEMKTNCSTVEAILTRTSVRMYEDKAIEPEKVDTLLRAGMAAPTACNQQPWHFVAVDDPDILLQLSKANQYSSMAAEAPLAIVVCGDMRKAEGMCGEFWVQDVSAATENILLAAHAMGLGAVWTGIYPMQERVAEVGRILQLPEYLVAFNIIIIGYPGEHPTPKNKYSEENISYNHFGGAPQQERKAKPESVKTEFREFDVVDEYGENPFATFENGWLVCAGDKVKSNAMTIGWGGMGTLWRKPAVTVYVAEARYTKQFMDKCKYFTIMQFGQGYENVIKYMGTKSGRDGDKAAALGLHTLYTENGTPYYEEASVVIECELMYADQLGRQGFKDVPTQFYANFDAGLHSMYIGKVVKAMKKGK
ncbi:MAG: nitroreductase family protein [Bacteroidales bacterium]|nr:nitroreductase family protein [Bacteroidales bacterium]